MTDPKPTTAEQFAAFFAASLPTRDLSDLFADDTTDTEENDQ